MMKPSRTSQLKFRSRWNGAPVTVDLLFYPMEPTLWVVGTNPDGDEGMSITNAAEEVWTKVAATYQRPGWVMRYVEHYPQRGDLPETYDEVTFARIRERVSGWGGTHELSAPMWHHLERPVFL